MTRWWPPNWSAPNWKRATCCARPSRPLGSPQEGNTKAELIATLEAYLTLLATQKRAVLIVDEAQNLNRDAIEASACCRSSAVQVGLAAKLS